MSAGPSSVQPASMRPRVFPAEDRQRVGTVVADEPASMRPRVFPAEDRRRPTPYVSVVDASMRPRVFPAEDCSAAEGATARRLLQ